MGGAEDYAGRAPVTADVQRELAAGIRPWVYPEDGEGGHAYRERIATQQANRAAAALLPTVQALIADAEKRAAAAALREAADWIWDDAPARASASAELHARADALDQT